ncbi:WD repeat and FYVE domain-containing protein 3 [Amphibalanus amphitrite]|uniref:WD repeat and FYVE domain-containing protein 3 n=1 Tax=Amphibalanus amphitrite TaxID=1232801 RepID=A0A6A4X0G7_AMPAM|nr:WD repeat and FYVE domain-containing protein 3 [Amphibalanus amphitrite]
MLGSGIFKRDAHEVLDFIIKLIGQARRWSQTLPLDSVYHCLNRAVLYILSRPTDSVGEQLRVLEALHTLTNHRSLVFGSGNHDSEFFGALVYCLLQLTGGLKIITEAESRTVWHAIPSTLDPETNPNTAQGHNLMANAARRVWSELYIWKRPAVEEVFKVSLPLENNTAPDLDTVRASLQDPATRLWVAFLEGEKKCSYRPPWEIQAQLQTVSSKLQRVTGGLSRLAQRTRSRREDSVRARPSPLTPAEVELWTLQHIAGVRESVVTQFRQFKQSQKYMEDFIMDEWLRMERELTRERGLWGPSLDKWQLDTTEGPCRMRKRTVSDVTFYQRYPYRPDLETVVQVSTFYQRYPYRPDLETVVQVGTEYRVPTVHSTIGIRIDPIWRPWYRWVLSTNGTFYQRYPYRPDLETVVQRGAAKYKVPVCRDARAWSQQPRRRSLLGRTEAGRTAAAVDTMSMTEEEGTDCADIGEKLRQAGEWKRAGLRGSLRRRRLTSDPDEEPESLDLPDSATDGPAGGERQPSADVEDTSPDNQTLLRLLEHGEKVLGGGCSCAGIHCTLHHV